MCLAVDTDDRLGIALAQVHPFIGEVYLHAVDISYLLVLIEFLHLSQDGIHIGIGRQVHPVLGHEVGRIGGTQFTHFLSLVCQVAQEEGNAHQGVTAIMAGRIDDTTVSFTADDGTHFLHLGRHVHLAHGRSVIGLSIAGRHITQGTRGTEVGNRCAGRVFQYIVCYADQRILLAIHASVLANDCQTVHIRVYDKSHVIPSLCHQAHNVAQVTLQGFGIMLEVAGRLTVQFFYVLNPQSLQQFGQDNSPYRIDAINSHVEIRLTDSLHVHQVKGQDTINMLLVISQVLAVRAQFVHLCILKGFGLRNAQHFVAFLLVEELTLLVQQLQGVPLLGVMRSGQDDAAAGAFHGHGQFGSRSGGKVDVHHIPAHTHQGTDHHVLHHFSGKAGVTSYHNFITLHCTRLANQGRISRCELHDIQRVQPFTGLSANSTADAGYGFN